MQLQTGYRSVSAIVVAVFLCLAAGGPGTTLRAQIGLNPRTQAGFEALQAGNADRAASLFGEAVASTPRDPLAHLGAGIAAHLLGRDEDAVVALSRALELEPRLAQAALLLGEIQYALGDVEAAARSYEKAAAAAPRSRDIQARLAMLKREIDAHRSMETWSSGSFAVVVEGRSARELGPRALAILDAGYWRIGKAIGAFPSNRITVTLYTEEQFRDFTNAPDWSDGVFDGRIRMPVGGVTNDHGRFEHVLTHEMVHALITGLAPENVPAWLHEGLASYFEPVDRAPIERLMKTVPMIPLSRLQRGFGRMSAAQATVAYAESVIAAALLFEHLGPRTAILLQALSNGQTFDSALTTLGMSSSDFERELKGKFRAPVR